MYKSLASVIRRIAATIDNPDSAYQNIPYYQPSTDISDIGTKEEIQDGPPSLYTKHFDKKKFLDTVYQGPNPPVTDVLIKDRERANINPGDPIQNLNGDPTRNPNQSPNEKYFEDDFDRDTIGFNPGEKKDYYIP